jgi:hypothetical protein
MCAIINYNNLNQSTVADFLTYQFKIIFGLWKPIKTTKLEVWNNADVNSKRFLIQITIIIHATMLISLQLWTCLGFKLWLNFLSQNRSKPRKSNRKEKLNFRHLFATRTTIGHLASKLATFLFYGIRNIFVTDTGSKWKVLLLNLNKLTLNKTRDLWFTWNCEWPPFLDQRN